MSKTNQTLTNPNQKKGGNTMTIQEKITYYQAHKQYNLNSLYGKFIKEYRKQSKLHKEYKTNPKLKAQLKDVNLYNSPEEYHNIIKTAKHFRINQYYKKNISLTEEEAIYAITRILTTTQLNKLETERQKYIDQKQNAKQIQHNQKQIIRKEIKNMTDKQVEQIATKLQELEQKYILQLDTDYTNKQSILQSWQQILYYKEYHIRLQLRETEETEYYEEEYYPEEQSYDLDDLLEEYPELRAKIWNPEERRN